MLEAFWDAGLGEKNVCASGSFAATGSNAFAVNRFPTGAAAMLAWSEFYVRRLGYHCILLLLATNSESKGLSGPGRRALYETCIENAITNLHTEKIFFKIIFRTPVAMFRVQALAWVLSSTFRLR